MNDLFDTAPTTDPTDAVTLVVGANYLGRSTTTILAGLLTPTEN